ncbi:acetoin utilization protein AcuC [uncultured Desulfuromonas sp.]|uniref:acetoin utilization protein AcuC n=2 Tax=Desulfuromonas TaxID=890 RepID=UPI0026211999|nr:acetoin utilization protein AcuC [uncultured Desulfuromonas sp.]
MKDSCALIYSSRFSGFSYGEEHPFKVLRYRLTYDLIRELGLLAPPEARVVECPRAPEEALLSYHDADYLKTLKEFSRAATPRANFLYGLGDVENPVFPGVYEWSRLGCGGTLEAARQVVEENCRVAFNVAGGYHHAHRAKASGFSYLNDAVVAILSLLERGLRVAYVDIDAHHGDGVQEAFYDTDQVLTISLHETGDDFFPQTGFTHELGRNAGYGYSINVPFSAHADDLIFEQAFRRIVLPLIEGYRPDVLVTQLGVDSLRTDPLTRLECTTGAIEYAARSFAGTGLPWVALGGGGYDEVNVARTWTLVWAIMAGIEVPDRLPGRVVRRLKELGYASDLLRDEPRLAHPDDFARAQANLEQHLAFLERRVFPLFGLTPGETP